jgi:hypothetical protein
MACTLNPDAVPKIVMNAHSIDRLGIIIHQSLQRGPAGRRRRGHRNPAWIEGMPLQAVSTRADSPFDARASTSGEN